MVAAAIERKVWIPRSTNLYPNLYTIIIGKSGLTKKSTITSVGASLLRDLHTINIAADQATEAGFFRALCGSETEFLHKGEIITQTAMFVYATEFALFVKEVYGTLVEPLTKLFDNNDFFERDLVEKKGKAVNPTLNILACSTKEWLVTKCIPPNEQAGGFASRCLFVVEEGKPDKFVPFPPPLDRTMRNKIMEDLRDIHETVGEMKITPAAHQLYSEWYNKYMTMKHDNPDPSGRFNGYYGRKGDFINKIALIKSICEGRSFEINESHIAWAITEIDSLEDNMMRVFQAQSKWGNLGEPLFSEGAGHYESSIEYLKNEFIGHGGTEADFWREISARKKKGEIELINKGGKMYIFRRNIT